MEADDDFKCPQIQRAGRGKALIAELRRETCFKVTDSGVVYKSR
jgi:hypothetical protein